MFFMSILISTPNQTLLSLCCPKPLVDRTSFHLQGGYGSLHLDRALRVGKDFPAGKQQVFRRWPNDLVKVHFAQSVNDPPNLTPVYCSSAHGARLGTGI